MSGDHASAAATAQRAARIAGYRACPGHVWGARETACRECGAPRSWVAAERKKEGKR